MKRIKKFFISILALSLCMGLCACSISKDDLELISAIVSEMSSTEAGEVSEEEWENFLEVEENENEELTEEPDEVLESELGTLTSIEPVSQTSSEQKEEEVSETSVQEENYVEYSFRNKKLWEEHYEKHGIDMGFANKEDYAEAANKVINNPDSLYKVEKEDGDDIFYLEETNEFVVVSKDGYIRTYFNPDKGKKYFDKQ